MILHRDIILAVLIAVFAVCTYADAQENPAAAGKSIRLPRPRHEGGISVEEAIFKRRSVRRFDKAPITLEEVSQLLWAAGGATVDGVTGPTRAYPSAGGIYPLKIYLVAGNVSGLKAGIYRYEWEFHALVPLKDGDMREELKKAALSQRMVQEAPATIVVTAVYDKVIKAYGQRGATRYVSMDTGHVGQNVHLEAQSLGLGTVMVGAFMDQDVLTVLGVKNELPLYMMPVGKLVK